MAKRTEEQLIQDIAIPQALLAWRDKMNGQMAAIAAKYPDNERLMWPTLTVEAEKHLVDSEASTPMLEGAAMNSEMNITDLANLVLANSLAFTTVSGQLMGLRMIGGDQIKACTTLEELNLVREALEL